MGAEQKKADGWQVYILYTGVTKDVDARVDVHNTGQGAKYTRGRLPVELVHAEAASDHGAALRRESEIKRMPRQRKIALANR